eukprot:8048357-Pyramimonas_sp.AAC.1
MLSTPGARRSTISWSQNDTRRQIAPRIMERPTHQHPGRTYGHHRGHGDASSTGSNPSDPARPEMQRTRLRDMAC